MAVSSNGRARGLELLEESIILVDLHYGAIVSQASTAGARGEPTGDIRPKYDALRRELWYDGQLIKRLRQASPNQEPILAAFDEEEWPPEGIFDPLKPDGESDPAKRLRDTLAALNRHHQTPGVLHFTSDGTGQGIRWGRCAQRLQGGSAALRVRRAWR